MSRYICWFCEQELQYPPYCSFRDCKQKYVTYTLVTGKPFRPRDLIKVQFKTTTYSGGSEREYIINYYPPKMEMEIVEQKRVPINDNEESPWESFNFKTILTFPYDSLILTPNNVDQKLPTLLTFL